MPSVFSHAVAATAIGAVMIATPPRLGVWGLGALCAMLPDLDVVAFAFDLPYGDMLGHRGLSHSLPFAAGLAFVATSVAARRLTPGAGALRLWAFFFAATASHGLLDAMTDGGLGIAFFSPFVMTRYFLPWTPVHVSPIGIVQFFSRWGVAALLTEIAYIWIPVTLAALAVRRVRSRREKKPVE